MLGLPELIVAFAQQELDFVIIGGVAAVAHGSARLTHDVDIMIRFAPEAMEKLLQALAPYAPRFRGKSVSLLSRTADELAGFRNIYLTTSLSDLDILGECPVGDFETVVERAEILELFGRPVKVMSLDDLIRSKELLGREKDRHVLLELRTIREALETGG